MKRRKRIIRKTKLTPEQVRDMMENKLRSKKIPSKSKYNRREDKKKFD